MNRRRTAAEPSANMTAAMIDQITVGLVVMLLLEV